MNLRYREASGKLPDGSLSHIQPISIDAHVLFNPYLIYLYFLLTTLHPTLIQIFTIILTIYAAGVELNEGTAKNWLACAECRIGAALIGKQIIYPISFVLLSLVMRFFCLSAPAYLLWLTNPWDCLLL